MAVGVGLPALCNGCGNGLVFASDAKAGEPVLVTCRTPGCRGNVATPHRKPLALRCFGAQLGKVEGRYEVLVDVSGERRPATSMVVMAQIDASADLEVACRNVVADSIATLRSFWERLPHVERAQSEAVLAAAARILDRLEESRRG